MCLGLNYISHAKESAQARGREFKIPEAPVFFTKAPTTVSGPTDPIPWDPSVTAQVDYEAELGVVIGIPGKNIPRARALDHVFGYTIINDVSARDLQKTPPAVVQGQEPRRLLPDGPGRRHRRRVRRSAVEADLAQGQRRREAELDDGEHDFPGGRHHRVAVAGHDASSRATSSRPARRKASASARTPQEFLKDGDLVETEVEGIGVMRNRVVRT